MRILITGFTARHVGSQRLKYDYQSTPVLLKNILTDLGHTVDHRAVEVGERDLPQRYDRALIGVFPPLSLGAHHAFSGLYALAAFPRDRTTMFFDDSTSSSIVTQTKTALKHWPKWFYWRSPKAKALAKTFGESLFRDQLTRLISADAPPVLATLFPWANVEKFNAATLPEALIFPFDPTMFVDQRAVQLPDLSEMRTARRRERVWVNASLANHDEWVDRLGLTWPVVKFGVRKKMGGGRLTGETSSIVPESEVCRTYAKSWGVLSFPYEEAIAGWWRIRYYIAARTGNVVLTDGAERRLMGAYGLNDPAAIERLPSSALEQIAARQSEWFFQSVKSRRAALRQLKEVLL